MILPCQGCAHVKRLPNGEFDCAKSRCVVPVKSKPTKKKAPEQKEKPWANLVLTPEQAGWKKHKGDTVRYIGDNPELAGQSFRQRKNDVVVLNGIKYLSLDKVPGELVPMRHCE
ncbi:hypothetical protein ACV1DV_16430 [Aeromonas veronii]